MKIKKLNQKWLAINNVHRRPARDLMIMWRPYCASLFLALCACLLSLWFLTVWFLESMSTLYNVWWKFRVSHLNHILQYHLINWYHLNHLPKEQYFFQYSRMLQFKLQKKKSIFYTLSIEQRKIIWASQNIDQNFLETYRKRYNTKSSVNKKETDAT